VALHLTSMRDEDSAAPAHRVGEAPHALTARK